MGWKALSSWALSALWHSAVCFAVPTLALAGGGGGGEGSFSRNLGLAGGGPHASSEGLWQTGTLGFTLVVVVVNLKLLVASRAHTLWHVVVVALSVGAYLGYLAVYSSLSPGGAVLSRIAPAAAIDGVAGELSRNPDAWISLGTAACLLPDLALSSVAGRGGKMKAGGEEEEGNGGGGGGAIAACVSVVVSAAKNKNSSLGRSSDKLKAGIAAEEDISSCSCSSSPSAAPIVAVAAESSPPAAPAPPFPPPVSFSSGKPPLHPVRSVSLQSRISEHQQQQRDGATSNNSTTLARRSPSAGLSSAASSPSSAPPSARNTGYAFDHPGFESFFADEAEREVRRTSLSARVSGGGGGAVVSTANADGTSSAVATAATSASGVFSSPPPLPEEDDDGTQLQLQRLSFSGRRYTATDAIDLA